MKTFREHTQVLLGEDQNLALLAMITSGNQRI